MKIVGIDLGTTNSVLTEYKNGRVEVIEIQGQKTLPSVVYIDGNGKKVVGREAKARAVSHPGECLISTKREIGTDWSKTINGKKYTAIDAASYILEEIKKNIGGSAECVITVPAYFNDDQRRDTFKAAEQAGLKVLRLISEPTAAAISYGLDKEKDQTLIVIDFGGGTFDVSLLEVKDNSFITKSVGGNDRLGGDDIDLAIVTFILDAIKDEHNVDLKSDDRVVASLKEYAEKAKIELATKRRTEIFIPEIKGGLSLELGLTRRKLKELIQPILDEIVTKTKDVIASSGLEPDDINRFVLVGGSCKHPLVQEVIKENFKEPFMSDNLDTIVAQGAAVVCASLGYVGEVDGLPLNIEFKEVIAHSIGQLLLDEDTNKEYIRQVLKKDTNYPVKEVVFSFPVYLDQTKILNRIYRGESKKVEECTQLGELLVDIIPEAVGVEHTIQLTIFELDKNGILTFTSAQVRPSSPEFQDLKPIITTSYDENVLKEVLDYSEVEQFLNRHNIERKVVTIDTIK